MSADLKLDALDRFTPGTGQYRIAEALLNAEDWVSRSKLAAVGRVAGTAVPNVVRRLRWECGVDVKIRRDHESGQAEYRVGDEQTQPVPAAAEPEQVAA